MLPLNALQYLAAGKPVVPRPLAALSVDGEHVRLAARADWLVAEIDAGTPARRSAGSRRALTLVVPRTLRSGHPVTIQAEAGRGHRGCGSPTCPVLGRDGYISSTGVDQLSGSLIVAPPQRRVDPPVDIEQ